MHVPVAPHVQLICLFKKKISFLNKQSEISLPGCKKYREKRKKKKQNFCIILLEYVFFTPFEGFWAPGDPWVLTDSRGVRFINYAQGRLVRGGVPWSWWSRASRSTESQLSGLMGSQALGELSWDLGKILKDMCAHTCCSQTLRCQAQQQGATVRARAIYSDWECFPI